MLLRWLLASNINIKGRYVKVRITCHIEIIDLQLPTKLGNVFIDIGELPGYIAPLLVYAELLNSDDPRNLETAKRIYHDHLA